MMNTKIFDINALTRENILRMKPYASARDEFTGEAEVFLDANENPYPSPYNRYPDPLQGKIKERLAVIKKVDPEQIFLGNGSDEAIDLLIRAFCEPNRDSIIITEPTYGMYAVCADVNAVAVRSLTLTPDFDIDTERVLSAADQHARIVFLCSPNNPTANLLTKDRVRRVLTSFNGLVVIDEAYIDFTDADSWLNALDEFPNLVVLQTFSKAWGLAGLRCGMAFASPAIISILNKIKYPYNINIKTQELVLEALQREEQKDAWVADILRERETLAGELSKLSTVIKVFPSDANFILARIQDAKEVYRYLMNNKIIVRDRSRVVLCHDCLRITVGTPSENQRLIQSLKLYKPTQNAV